LRDPASHESSSDSFSDVCLLTSVSLSRSEGSVSAASSLSRRVRSSSGSISPMSEQKLELLCSMFASQLDPEREDPTINKTRSTRSQ
jgi:hypothetical protein